MDLETTLDITGTTTYTRFSLAIGEMLLPLQKVFTESFCHLGKIIQHSSSNPIGQQTREVISELLEKLNQLLEKADENRKLFAALLGEHEFHDSLVGRVESLMRLLTEMIEFRTEESIENFKEFYDIEDANETLSSILNDMEDDEDNPLTSAMNADPYKSKMTFELWRKCFTNLLMSVTMAYAVYEGLNDRESEKIDREMKDMEERWNNFKDGYETNYWPEVVENIMKETAEKSAGLTIGERSQMLVKELLRIRCKTDVLVTLVYNETTGFENHTFVGVENSYRCQFRFAGCCMVVYRCRTSHKTTAEEGNEMWKQITAKINEKPIYNPVVDGMKESANELFAASPLVGFIGLMKKNLNIDCNLVGADALNPFWWAPLSVITTHPWYSLKSDVREDIFIIAAPR